MDLSNTPVLNSLNDVRLLLPVIYSPESARVYDYKLKKAARLAGRKLTQIPACERDWAILAAKIVWTGEFRGTTPGQQKDAFDAFVRSVGNAIARAGSHIATPVIQANEDAAWERLQTYAAEVENTFDTEGERILPNMMSLSIANLRARCRETHPAKLNATAISAALAVAPPDKAATLRNSVSAFNGVIRNRQRHPAIADLLPDTEIRDLLRIRDTPLDWSRFGAGFLLSRDRAIRVAIRGERESKDKFGGKLGPDPMADRRAARRGKRKSVRNPAARTKAHLNALSWLVRHAFELRDDAYGLARIEELFSVEIIERAVERYVERATTSKTLLDPDKTSTGTTVLSNLETLAMRNGYSEEVLWAIDDARY